MAYVGKDPRPWRQKGNSWYNTLEWRQLRMAVLRVRRICAYCNQAQATTVDHIMPHRGDRGMFFNALNLQALCKQCHDSAKRREENLGQVRGVDANGMPNDSNHLWHNDERSD